MADISDIKLNSRMWAEITAGTALAAQRTLLENAFKKVTGNFTEPQAEATSLTMEGSNSSFQYRGATHQEIATALRLAIEEIKTEIAEQLSGPRPFGIRFVGGPHETLA